MSFYLLLWIQSHNTKGKGPGPIQYFIILSKWKRKSSLSHFTHAKPCCNILLDIVASPHKCYNKLRRDLTWRRATTFSWEIFSPLASFPFWPFESFCLDSLVSKMYLSMMLYIYKRDATKKWLLKYLFSVSSNFGRGTPVMTEEYKIPLIVKSYNSPTTEIRLLWEKWLDQSGGTK